MGERQSLHRSPTHFGTTLVVSSARTTRPSINPLLYFHLSKISSNTMPFTVFITALITLHHSESFTPVTRYSQPQRTRTQSAGNLFDAEQSSPWSIQEWSIDFPETLSTEFASVPPPNLFLPSKEDLRVVEKAVAAANLGSRLTESKLLENEFPDAKKKIRANVRETGTDSIKNYIKTMCNHELLNKNEEIILAREIQILLKWEKQREELENQLLRYVFRIVMAGLIWWHETRAY